MTTPDLSPPWTVLDLYKGRPDLPRERLPKHLLYMVKEREIRYAVITDRPDAHEIEVVCFVATREKAEIICDTTRLGA